MLPRSSWKGYLKLSLGDSIGAIEPPNLSALVRGIVMTLRYLRDSQGVTPRDPVHSAYRCSYMLVRLIDPSITASPSTQCNRPSLDHPARSAESPIRGISAYGSVHSISPTPENSAPAEGPIIGRGLSSSVST
jgi:hypothetical protein